VLRMQEDDVISLLDSTQQDSDALIPLHAAPLDGKDPRAQSVDYSVHNAEATLAGIELLQLWQKELLSANGLDKPQLEASETSRIVEHSRAISEQFKSAGYIRIRFPRDSIVENVFTDAILSAVAFFKLPSALKQASSLYSANPNYQNRLGYGKPNTFNKEYFIYRNVEHKSENNDLPSNNHGLSLDFHDRLSALFSLQTAVASAVAWLVFQHIGFSRETIQTLLMRASQTAPIDHYVAYRSMMEAFCYTVPDFSSENKQEVHVACAEHGDVSLLTCIPHCVGRPGLEVMAWQDGKFRQVEQEDQRSFEFIVFPGEQMQRISNAYFSPTQHRVFFRAAPPTASAELSKKASAARYSIPYELLLAPDTVLQCEKWLDADVVGWVSPSCALVETMKQAVDKVSAGLISVNKS